MRVEQKYDENHCIGKEYPMKDETKESEIQAQTFQKSYIFVQHFLYRTAIISRMRKPHFVQDRVVTARTLENGMFLYINLMDTIYVLGFTITSLLCLMCDRDL